MSFLELKKTKRLLKELVQIFLTFYNKITITVHHFFCVFSYIFSPGWIHSPETDLQNLANFFSMVDPALFIPETGIRPDRVSRIFGYANMQLFPVVNGVEIL